MGAINSTGTQFRRYDIATAKWQWIGNVISISGPALRRGTVESTTLGNSGYRSFIGVRRDYNDLTLEVQFSRSTYDVFRIDFRNNVIVNYALLLSDSANTVLEFQGLVKSLSFRVVTGELVQNTVIISVLGQMQVSTVGLDWEDTPELVWHDGTEVIFEDRGTDEGVTHVL